MDPNKPQLDPDQLKIDGQLIMAWALAELSKPIVAYAIPQPELGVISKWMVWAQTVVEDDAARVALCNTYNSIIGQDP